MTINDVLVHVGVKQEKNAESNKNQWKFKCSALAWKANEWRKYQQHFRIGTATNLPQFIYLLQQLCLNWTCFTGLPDMLLHKLSFTMSLKSAEARSDKPALPSS
jgi:hypothetical protein